MNATPSHRDKLVLTGLYLAKFDVAGVAALGFSSFLEAFNVIGFALGTKPASLKNYRDEFDPLFPNARKGWHKRPTRSYCLDVYERYRVLDFRSFTLLIESFFERAPSLGTPEIESGIETSGDSASFMQRLMTGEAAEHYFESIHSTLVEFEGRRLVNVTRYGCGYDFRMDSEEAHSDFVAVEVKGLREQSGNLSLTEKEHRAASDLGERFYLFVVRNFRETPNHVLFRNPIVSQLLFTKCERVVVQTSWSARI